MCAISWIWLEKGKWREFYFLRAITQTSMNSVILLSQHSSFLMNRKGITMIKWQEYRPKKDIIKPFALFNFLKRNGWCEHQKVVFCSHRAAGQPQESCQGAQATGRHWELWNLLPDWVVQQLSLELGSREGWGWWGWGSCSSMVWNSGVLNSLYWHL